MLRVAPVFGLGKKYLISNFISLVSALQKGVWKQKSCLVTILHQCFNRFIIWFDFKRATIQVWLGLAWWTINKTCWDGSLSTTEQELVLTKEPQSSFATCPEEAATWEKVYRVCLAGWHDEEHKCGDWSWYRISLGFILKRVTREALWGGKSNLKLSFPKESW